MSDDLAALEAIGLAAGPDDTPDISAQLADDLPPEDGANFSAGVMPDEPQFLTPDAFYQQTFMVAHLVGSGIASTMTRRDVDLISLAQSQQGQMTSAALYRVFDRYDFARRWFLTEGSNVMMDLGVVLAYGQSIRSAIGSAPQAASE